MLLWQNNPSFGQLIPLSRQWKPYFSILEGKRKLFGESGFRAIGGERKWKKSKMINEFWFESLGGSINRGFEKSGLEPLYVVFKRWNQNKLKGLYSAELIIGRSFASGISPMYFRLCLSQFAVAQFIEFPQRTNWNKTGYFSQQYQI